MSPSYRKRLRQKHLERSRKGVLARERKRMERAAGEPVREWARVRRITDEAAYRTRRIIEVWAMDCGEDGVKTKVTDNGRPTTFRSQASAVRALAVSP